MTALHVPARTVVVVAFAEALAAPEVVWSLVDDGFVVIGVTRRGTATALAHSRWVSLHEIPAPEVDAPSAQRALVELLDGIRRTGGCARHVLLPLDDSALWLCSAAARAAGWVFAGPGNDTALTLALDKRLQIEAARAAGLRVPPTVAAESAHDLRSLPFAFPVILRPAQAIRVSGTGTGAKIEKGRNWICADPAELAAAARAWNGAGEMLVQPYIEGIGEGVFGLMTPAGVVCWSAHRRLRMMNPHGSGSSACVSRAVDEDVKVAIGSFLAAVGWRGMFMVELLRDAAGRLHFVEFNGRAWGSMALARRLGLEYPSWSVRHALGRELPASALPAPRAGVVCRNLGRELMHLMFVLRGRRSNAIRRWPGFWSALRDVLRPNAGGSFYNWRRDDWRVFPSDCYYTIVRNVAKRGRA
jgi:predicted ATP-grasp superfamily ATP-dependent carboligase